MSAVLESPEATVTEAECPGPLYKTREVGSHYKHRLYETPVPYGWLLERGNAPGVIVTDWEAVFRLRDRIYREGRERS